MIKDMSDSHLINTIKFLERYAEQIALTTLPPLFNGEMAQFYADQEWDNLQDDPVGVVLGGSIYDDLYREYIRRKLTDLDSPT